MKIVRRMDTPEAREFWRFCDEAAKEVSTWPDWKRAGINVLDQLPVNRSGIVPPSNLSDKTDEKPE